MCMRLARPTLWRFYHFGILIALISICAQSFAQETQTFRVHPDYTVYKLTHDDGLPSDLVRDIISTRDGYLWFGTEEGITRFDGKQTTNYAAISNPGLASNIITQLAEGPDNSLWVVSLPNKLSVFANGQFKTLASPDELPANREAVYVSGDSVWVMTMQGVALYESGRLSPYRRDVISTQVTSIQKDDAGWLWVATSDDGLYRIAASGTVEGEEHVRHFTETDGLPSLHLTQVFLCKNGTSWVATRGGGLFRVAGDEVDVLRLPDGQAVVIHHEDDQGATWYSVENEGWWQCSSSGRDCSLLPLSSSDHIASYFSMPPDGSHWRVERLTEEANTEGKYVRVYRNSELVFEVKGYISNLFFGQDNSVWISSLWQGLFRIRKSLSQTIGMSAGLPNIPSNILEDREGMLWIGTLHGGLVRMDREKGIIEPVEFHASEWPKGSQSVLTTFVDPAGELWVGGRGALCNVKGMQCVAANLPISLSSRMGTRILLEDRYGRFWIGGRHKLAVRTSNGDWKVWTEEGGNPLTVALRSILETKDGSLFFRTANSGVFFYHPASANQAFWEGDELIDPFESEYFESFTVADGLPSNNLTEIYEDSEGYIWFMFKEHGLCRLDRKAAPRLADADLACIDSRNGLHYDSLFEMIEDDQRRLWFNSRKGIFWVLRSNMMAYFDGHTSFVSSVSYKESDGFPSRKGISGESGSLRSRDGLLWYSTLGGLSIINPEEIPVPKPPRVLIESVDVGEQNISNHGPVFLTAKERDISLNFTAIELRQPDDIHFQYKLEGYDEYWQNAGSRRQAVYTNLNPGKYTFKVRAGLAGTMSETAALAVERAPFFWQTGWFYTLVVLCLAFAGRAMYVRRVRQLHARKVELESIVVERTAELRRANELKSRFLANISHEFRTPLTLTFGPLDDLLQGRFKVEEAARPYLESARRNGSKILRLINQLLDLSKLDAGALLLRTRQHDLAQHIRQITALFESLTETRKIDFVIQIPDEPFYHVYDADKLEKVVINLLSNAFKFTPKGGKVSIALDPKEDDRTENITAEITIADTGVGIAKEHLPHLFDRFYQVESDTKRSYEGTGIGLALVKELVELHEGTIEVTSTVGFGTSFLVRIPSGASKDSSTETSVLSAESDVFEYSEFDLESEASKQRATRDQTETGSRHSAQILIIEDNEDMRTYIRGHLDEDYAILEAENGRKGVEKAIEMVPDLILSDVMMPEMDGLEACAAIKADERTSHIPVILLTARAEVEHRIAGFESGADAYLPKPFNARELLVRVRTLIEERQKLRERFIARSQAPKAERVEGSVARDDQIEFADTGTPIPPPDIPTPALPPREVAFLEKVEALIDEQLGSSQFGLDQMAETLMMSRRQLQRKMRALTHEGPTAMLRQKRLAKAATLLKSDDMSVKEVCYAVGFQSKSSFARAFREAYGMSPSEYRAQ